MIYCCTVGHINQGVRGEFGLVGFLAVCFLHKINPNPTIYYLLAAATKKKVAQNATFKPSFSWVGLASGCWGVRRFHKNVYLVYVFQPNIIW